MMDSCDYACDDCNNADIFYDFTHGPYMYLCSRGIDAPVPACLFREEIRYDWWKSGIENYDPSAPITKHTIMSALENMFGLNTKQGEAMTRWLFED